MEYNHLCKTLEVLIIIQDYGFHANVRKSSFMIEEIEYSIYLLTKESIKPQPKKIEPLHHILLQKSTIDVNHFFF